MAGVVFAHTSETSSVFNLHGKRSLLPASETTPKIQHVDANSQRALLASPVKSPLKPKDTPSTPMTGSQLMSAHPVRQLSTIEQLLKDRVQFVAASKPDQLQSGPPAGAIDVCASEGPIASTSKLPFTNGHALKVKLQYSAPEPRSPAATARNVASTPEIARGISLSWPRRVRVGPGFNNVGNTCFLNSALQVLVHTAPLVSALTGTHWHSERTCYLTGRSQFCLVCVMQDLINRCFGQSRSPLTPRGFTDNLKRIAKHFRLGRQEDSHELLRFVIDGMQQHELAGVPPDALKARRDTTMIHRIFGGKLRSRVLCNKCGHASDTFESFLDLSLDIQGLDHLRDALRRFFQPDDLRGQNKYKCEACTRMVEATKQYTIQSPPQVLTLHLKRFTPLGKKIGRSIGFDEDLNLGRHTSEDHGKGLRYRLYGIVHHAGGGPQSGHYIAHVRDSVGSWNRMDDSHVSPSERMPRQSSTAYVLFYARDVSLSAAINGASPSSGTPSVASHAGTSRNMSHAGSSNGHNETHKRKASADHEHHPAYLPQKYQSNPFKMARQHDHPQGAASHRDDRSRGPPDFSTAPPRFDSARHSGGKVASMRPRVLDRR
ncbi:uncharacterized protein L969DRAFT_76895 [Mixia osmundae IAM 14324]|uniref:Ubiquitin carboxyl-terminal hydrolase n=1 Tax=Mixia osmundae (strain CBS 9802 / IAM 14324 / JCM 22182 / KY 12970) TaxID=764103 RepID=G7E841_MIXOS|nr:uncharacterized protein L969DRAFT_76895 [Mixia osmundae IAM 14324]KEI38601.1 hypothetical protein L969DRAFT_76895 [Mixia osmundae IAM 14324]GAA99001.1 hypothetical protein E5Q_05690 [Mixia osmundae IAM 14324]